MDSFRNGGSKLTAPDPIPAPTYRRRVSQPDDGGSDDDAGSARSSEDLGTVWVWPPAGDYDCLPIVCSPASQAPLITALRKTVIRPSECSIIYHGSVYGSMTRYHSMR